jgi:hypothetical protein
VRENLRPGEQEESPGMDTLVLLGGIALAVLTCSLDLVARP